MRTFRYFSMPGIINFSFFIVYSNRWNKMEKQMNIYSFSLKHKISSCILILLHPKYVCYTIRGLLWRELNMYSKGPWMVPPPSCRVFNLFMNIFKALVVLQSKFTQTRGWQQGYIWPIITFTYDQRKNWIYMLEFNINV